MRPADDPARRPAPDHPKSNERGTSVHQPGITPACPFCGSTDTEEISPFASQLSTSQYLCRACHSPFERFRR